MMIAETAGIMMRSVPILAEVANVSGDGHGKLTESGGSPFMLSFTRHPCARASSTEIDKSPNMLDVADCP